MNKSVVTGVVLIVIGVVFLLPNFTNIELRDLWPVLMLGPGILFFLGFIADRKNFGLLMPGAVLTTYGLLFLYCTANGWHTMRDLWPFYLIGPGIGFFLMYFFGRKETGLLVPGTILILLGAIFLLRATEYENLWPLLIIIAGIILIFKSRRRKEPTGNSPTPPGDGGQVQP